MKLPQKVLKILATHDELMACAEGRIYTGNPYTEAERIQTELNKIGYTCDYDLSGTMFDIKPIPISNIIDQWKKINIKKADLDFIISDHFSPIIEKLVSDKDSDGLEKLLIELPECWAKLQVYQGLQEIRKS